MHYDGPANHPVPSPQYDSYIKAFEKEVAAAQARIEQIRNMELLYNVCREVLLQCKIPQQNILSLGTTTIHIEVTLAEDDVMDEPEKMVEALGMVLRERGLHSSGKHVVEVQGLSLLRKWRVGKAKDKLINVSCMLPENGTRDYEVTQSMQTFQWEVHAVKRLENRRPKGWHRPVGVPIMRRDSHGSGGFEF